MRPMRNVMVVGAVVLALVVLGALALVRPACSTGAAAGPPASDLAGVSSVASTTASTGLTTTTSTTVAPVEITIAAVGDVMVHKATLRAAQYAGPGDSYDFRPTFASVAPYLSGVDYTVCNLETRLAGSQLAYTGFPRFNCPDELTDALSMCGVDLCATANNHTLDKDWPGIVNTLDRLDEAGITHVGTYRTAAEKAAASPLIVDIEGIKVAFINYTDYLNGFSLPNGYSIDFLDSPEEVAAEARAARAAGADVVIAILHWGTEYVTKPDGGQLKYAEGAGDYEGLLAEGVDVILGSHPHVVQRAVGVRQDGSKGSKNTYVVYSMGNFVSNMVKWRTDSGVIVYVHIKKTGQDVQVTGLSYMGVHMEQMGSYPRKVSIVPLLPGTAPTPGTEVSAHMQRRLDDVWEYLTDMFYDPDMNILPLDPADLSAAKE